MVKLNGEKQSCGKAFRIGNSPSAQAKPVAKNRYFICALIKDEHTCLREWALHHRSLGFDKIILYDDSGSQPYDGVVGDLIKEGFVEMRPWSDGRWSRQSRAFNEFVWSGNWGDGDYCAFIDPDEFIFFDSARNIDEFMENYRQYAGVGLSWRLYNANGRIKSPVGIPTPQAYTCEFEYWEPKIKVIGRLKDVEKFPTVHHFVPKRGKLVTTGGQTIYGMTPKYSDFTNGHIKHYITKSWEDWVRRLKRGNITKGLRTVNMFFRFNPDLQPLKFELTKDLDYDEFPTLFSDDIKWDGD